MTRSRDRGDELDVVGGDHDRAAGCRELAHDARSAVPWRRSRGRVSARRAAPRSVSRRVGSRARDRGVAPPRGRGGGHRPALRARRDRAAHAYCPATDPVSLSACAHSKPTVAWYSKSPGVCGTSATLRRRGAAGSCAGSVPSTVTVPPARAPEPWSAHSSEDLPEPLRPMHATTSPGNRSTSTERTATTSPYRTERRRAVRCGTASRRIRP